MSSVQQRTKKLQKIISGASLNDTRLQIAFRREIHDSESRKLSFGDAFTKFPEGCPGDPSDNSLRSSSDITVVSGSYAVENPLKARLPCRRVLVIFIRHFLCGNCQEYLLRLSSHPLMTVSNLSRHKVKVLIIGCGSPSHISSYRTLTNLPDDWSLYADPSTELYDSLGMQRSLKLGDRRPVYIQRTLTNNMIRSVIQGLKRMPKGDVSKAGAWDVNGGEYLFELQDNTDDWQLKWCHQMENSRDHTEVDDLVGVIGLNSTPNSPALVVSARLIPKVHGRSHSTPMLVGASADLDQSGSRSYSKRPFSLRRLSGSSRRQSWIERPGRVLTGVRKRELDEFVA